jgi:hypothetical protein
MVVCKQCGVELESGMQVCPLCETPVIDGRKIKEKSVKESFDDQRVKPRLLKHILWQIACVLLLSGILATLIINLSTVGQVTWSMYPVTICLIVLSYASLIALWNAKLIIQIITGWIASSAVLVVVQLYTAEDWPLNLALPIVSAVNMVSMLLILILSTIKVKGLNILAVVFIGVAIVCLIIEGILSLYFQNQMQFRWSAVVSACLLPVIAAIVFMYLRTRNNSDLKKIFHT